METDGLYYIMDCGGNYYKTNHADQLVAAKNRWDASIFTFAQANSRICVGKKSAFYCIVPVEKDAENNDRIEDAVFEVEAQEQKDLENSKNCISMVKELTYEEVTEQAEKCASSYDLSEMDWTEYLTHFMYLISGIKEYREKLVKRESDIDQKISDVLHYIELCKTSEAEAIDLVELLRVCRENRRDIKDELQRIEYFQSNLGTNANAAKANQALKSMKGLESRKYRPRKYEELFANSILKDRRLRSVDLCVPEADTENRNRVDSVYRLKGKGGGEVMAEERLETPYDGKENDWLLFARQQAEFYRNAGQYIRNLQIEINEIEEEIEAVLSETEDSNCNVTQGYKMFKRLKELRLRRKNKSQELNCLYALTDYIDCEALADTCEGNLAEIEDIMKLNVKGSEEKGRFMESSQAEIYAAEELNDMVG